MRRLLPLLSIAFLASTLTAQGNGAPAAPRVTQSLEFADGTAVTVRYVAVPWSDSDKRQELGTAEVKRGLKIGNHVVPEGRYAIACRQGDDGKPSLVLGAQHMTEPLLFDLRPSADHTRRLEIVLTAGDQDGHGVVRLGFGDLTGRLAIAPADPETLRAATARAGAGAYLETAKLEVRSILEQVQFYMIQNAGPVPQWADLIAADERGHRFIDLDEPKRDPWGNAYVITTDAEHPNKPFVMSLGPDGVKATADDITNKSVRPR